MKVAVHKSVQFFMLHNSTKNSKKFGSSLGLETKKMRIFEPEGDDKAVKRNNDDDVVSDRDDKNSYTSIKCLR